LNAPAVHELAFDGRGRGEFRKLVVVVDVENVRAVEVRRPVAAPQILRIVAVVVEAERALLVERPRIGVGKAGLKPVADLFFNVRLQSVVGRNSRGRVFFRIAGIPDVGDALVDVAAIGC
jgi:hypothetical protein